MNLSAFFVLHPYLNLKFTDIFSWVVISVNLILNVTQKQTKNPKIKKQNLINLKHNVNIVHIFFIQQTC